MLFAAASRAASVVRSRLSSRVRHALMSTPLLVVLAAMALGTTLSACTATREQTKSPRGAMEQLLLNRALERSLYDLHLPMLKGATVAVEIEGLPPDLNYVKTVVAEQLGLQGMQLRETRSDAQYVAEVMVHSLGTEQASSLIGMPEVTSAGVLPLALPELAIYKEQLQSGYARLSLAIYETATGALKQSVAWRAGSSYYNFYTVLFWFTFPATDLILPPTPESGFDYGLKHTTEMLGERENGNGARLDQPAP